MDLSFLPALNAVLNGSATVLLIAGRWLIRSKKNEPAHRAVMLAALGVSCLFLILYLTHKIWRAQAGQGLHTTFNAQGWLKALYLFILLSHTLLAAAVPVLAVVLVVLAFRRKMDAHRRLAQWAWPIWLYVSITGVAIYFMLYWFNPGM